MKIIFVLLFCCTSAFSFAASVPPRPSDDTSTQKKPYELDQIEFLEKYGRDDSSKALINLFFHKRKIGAANAAAGVPILIGGAIGIGVTGHAIDNGEANWDKVGQFFLFILILGAGIALSSVGISIAGKYSRKKLLRLLNNYFNGKHIPRGIAKNRAFRKMLLPGN